MTVDCIAIGTSLGGMDALRRLLTSLPATLKVPLVVVIHRASVQHDYLLEVLQKHTPLKVQEAQDRLAVTPGTITIAPADYHLLVDSGRFVLSLDAPLKFARPSIDALLESVADEYAENALGILLTGGGEDGLKGLQAIKNAGGIVLVENPQTAFEPGLPAAAIGAGIVSDGLTLEEISHFLAKFAEP
ncbi:chemotaxis protein CheB [Marinobacterium jannaschii]|uniref:chemotaxis protein CheB n=1 Tax=Marinobacterium jannaschii TaxID=64970 RepID=UPI000489CFD7|nr:chemotaxis protein CheB [Marinobacterium jannaschii]